ncbi:MAG: hypothetical protein APR55_04390 [Methanolinea sp. SDB]|nr:MAG: hypothetical protein APR55_04390 [Methanolinea sp. SDB]
MSIPDLSESLNETEPDPGVRVKKTGMENSDIFPADSPQCGCCIPLDCETPMSKEADEAFNIFLSLKGCRVAFFS